MLNVGEREGEVERSSLDENGGEENGSLLAGWRSTSCLQASCPSMGVQLLQAVVHTGRLVQRLKKGSC